MRKQYINIKSQHGETETIDEFAYDTKEEKAEAHQCLKEYRLAYQGQSFIPYLSSRCTKEWKER